MIINSNKCKATRKGEMYDMLSTMFCFLLGHHLYY